ncbi:MAG TPA: acyl carrier protein [Actinomycetota bacterium]|nr:acyl carrier protein [Actinomycetota bacterium]
MEIAGAVRSYITDELGVDVRAGDLDGDSPLLEGVLDSVTLFRLVSFLEEEFSVTIEDHELAPENFGSLNRIAEFVRSKRAG